MREDLIQAAIKELFVHFVTEDPDIHEEVAADRAVLYGRVLDKAYERANSANREN
ncbi:MAG: hypothetical protein HC888_05110 [Candidatus Competibacteraceae bacterium]|nr:hypothetical protein [Candidatus Competibacteraceae bacterium]